MNRSFWDMVQSAQQIQEADKVSPSPKRWGMVVYNEAHTLGPGGSVEPVMKGVSNFLSDNFRNMDHKDVMSALTSEPDEWFGKWVGYCVKNGMDNNDAFNFGWDWMTSGEGLVTPSNNR